MDSIFNHILHLKIRIICNLLQTLKNLNQTELESVHHEETTHKEFGEEYDTYEFFVIPL